MKTLKDQPLEIGNDYLISLLSQIKQRQLVLKYRKLLTKLCPMCETPLFLMYVDELGNSIFWECRHTCKRCQNATCSYTETTDLKGNTIIPCDDQYSFLF
jgi:hypothetical protein